METLSADGDLSESMDLFIREAGGIVENMNMMCNIVFYVTREPEIRRAMKHVLCCKSHLPLLSLTAVAPTKAPTAFDDQQRAGDARSARASSVGVDERQ